MTAFERDESVWWVEMDAKIRIVTEYRVELFHKTDTDTGAELGLMNLPRQAVWATDEYLNEAVRTREDVRIQVDLAELSKAAREMK